MSDPRMLPTLDGADLVEGDGDLELTDTLENAALLSLFGGNVADDGTDAARGQWWGNHVLPAAAALRGATQHRLANGPPVTSSERQAVERAALRDLEWLVPDHASRIDARVALSSPDELAVLAAVEEGPGRVSVIRTAVPRESATWTDRTHPRLVVITVLEPAPGAELPVLEGLEVRVLTSGPAAQVRVEAGAELLETTLLAPSQWIATRSLGAEHIGALRLTVTADNTTPGLAPVQSFVDVTVTNPTSAAVVAPLKGATQWEELPISMTVTTTGLVDGVRADLPGAGEAELVEGPAGTWTGVVSTNGEQLDATIGVYVTPTAGDEYLAAQVGVVIVSGAPGYPDGLSLADSPVELIAGEEYSASVTLLESNLAADEVVLELSYEGIPAPVEIPLANVMGTIWAGTFTADEAWVGQQLSIQAVARNAVSETYGDSIDLPVVAAYSAEWSAPSDGAALRWGETLTVDVLTTGSIASVSVTIGASTAAAVDQGGGLWRRTLTMTDAHYGSLAVSATVTPTAGDPIALAARSVSVALDLPAKSTGTTLPAVGAVTSWGDFATFSGSVNSSGYEVVVGTPAANGSAKCASGSVARSHTIVWRGRALGNTWSVSGALLLRHTDIAGGGCNMNLATNGTGAVTGQVYDSANAYVAQTYGTYTVVRQSTLILSRNADTGITSLYLDGALIGGIYQELDIDATTTTMNAALQCEGRQAVTYMGRWDRTFSAADAARVHAELLAAAPAVPAASEATGPVPAAGAVATWGDYAATAGGVANATYEPTSDGAEVDFDGVNDRLEYYVASGTGGESFTVAVRARHDEAVANAFAIASRRLANGFAIGFSAGTATLQAFIGDSSAAMTQVGSNATVASINTHHTYILSYHHTTKSAILSVDGVVVAAAGGYGGARLGHGGSHYIGHDTQSGGRYLDGSIREARYWHGTALSADQHRLLHAAMAA